MKPEHYIQNQIREWCGSHGYLAFRCNVGKVLTANNVYFDTGLPSGFSDLLILDSSGHAIFCEVKTATGRQRPDQLAFQKTVTERGFIYILARSVSDVEKVLTKTVKTVNDI